VPQPDRDPGLETSALESALDSAILRGDAKAALSAADDLVGRHALGAAAKGLEAAIQAFPTEPRFWTLLLDVLLRWRDWERFDQAAAKAGALFPLRPDVAFARGRAAEERGRTCRAVREYGRAARLDPEDLEPVQRMARLLRLAKRPFLARQRIRRALRIHPHAASLYGGLGYAYVQDGQYEKAVAAFRRAADLEPEDAPWFGDLGGTLLLLERWREAAACAVRALKGGRPSEKAWTVFAVSHRHLGNRQAAERGYRRAVEVARDVSRARGNLGLFLASLPPSDARTEEAASHLRAAVEAHPDWIEAAAALDALPRPEASSS
jgi:Flp pilus assembly protein TadD